MPYSFDPEKGKLIWLEDHACDWCKTQFLDSRALAIHRKQTRPSNLYVAGPQVCVQSSKDEASAVDEEHIQALSERTRGSNDRDDHDDNRGAIPIGNSRNIAVRVEAARSRGPDSYSSTVPKSSFLSSSSYRSSPISTFASQKRSDINLASPRSYNTALSSLASYATAPSVPHPRWGLRNLRNIPETVSSTILSEEMLESLKEKMNTLLKPHEDFDQLVDRVTSHILDHFSASDKVRAMTEDEKGTFRMNVEDCLWDLRLYVPGSDEGSEDETKSQSGAKNSDNKPGKTTNEGSETDSAIELEILEILEKLINLLAAYKLDSSGANIFELKSEKDRETLRTQIEGYVNLYLAGELMISGTAPGPVFSSEWLKHLHDRGILLDPKDELNWSGRGQHVEYGVKEEPDIPLQVKKVLGYSATAIVESVQCRRILLARKTVRCNRRMPKEQVVTEVEHLQRLRHSHIVRIVGTYTVRKNLAILLYPVADHNLEEFMDDIAELDRTDPDHGKEVMPTFFGCLSSAISFIHDKNVKHMDIKPKNILVRPIGGRYKVYIADFGIARSYQSAAESFTDTPTSFTRTYAAPEVILQDTRGYPADVFSLGCVFMEMLAVMVSSPLSHQRELLAQLRGVDYQASTEEVLSWYRTFVEKRWSNDDSLLNRAPGEPFLIAIPEMLHLSPEKRPLAKDLKRYSAQLCCLACDDGPEPFEAADPKSI